MSADLVYEYIFYCYYILNVVMFNLHTSYPSHRHAIHEVVDSA